MQKAVFLATMRGSERWKDLYSYRPYNWGPYAGALTGDLHSLEARGKIVVSPFAGSRYGSYATTDLGEAEAKASWSTLSDEEQKFLRSVRAYVTSSPFNKLLREVYAAYPDYATASQFNG